MKQNQKLLVEITSHLTTMVHADAENVIIAMGSVTESLEETSGLLKCKRRKSWSCKSSFIQTILKRNTS
jgi:pyruvate/2-oxoacid:ferredoxin oxidoreductase alpha subunit